MGQKQKPAVSSAQAEWREEESSKTINICSLAGPAGHTQGPRHPQCGKIQKSKLYLYHPNNTVLTIQQYRIKCKVIIIFQQSSFRKFVSASQCQRMNWNCSNSLTAKLQTCHPLKTVGKLWNTNTGRAPACGWTPALSNWVCLFSSWTLVVKRRDDTRGWRQTYGVAFWKHVAGIKFKMCIYMFPNLKNICVTWRNFQVRAKHSVETVIRLLWSYLR